jgi:hypothetical protein
MAGGLALAVLLLRAPFLGRDEPGLLWTIDEIEMSLTTLDRWLGVPHTGDHWSGAPLQLTLEPVLAVSFLTEHTPSVGALIDWLSRQYRSPWLIVWLARLLVAVVSSLGLASLFAPGRRSGAPVAIAMVLLIASVPEVWSEAVMATPGGFAIGWLALAIAIAASRASDAGALVAGLCMGIAVAARTTVAPATIFVCAVAAGEAAPRVRRALRAAIAALVSFIVLCPYVWIEPLRFLKATVGAIVQTGGPSGIVAAGRVAIDATTPWLVLVTLAAVAVAIRRRAFVLVGGMALSAMVMIAAAARGASLVPRYFVALPVIAGGFVLLAAGPEIAFWWRRRRQPIGIAAVMAVAVAVAVGVNASLVERAREHASTVAQPAIAVDRYLRAGVDADARLAIPESLDVYVADRLSAAATARLAEDAATAVSAAGVVDVLSTRYTLPRATVQALTDDFNEDERAAAARWRIRAVTAPSRGLNAVLHGERSHARRFGFLSTDDAIDQFNAGKFDVLVLEGITLPEKTPVFVSGEYRVYRR